jgi:predicted dehydrogenase
MYNKKVINLGVIGCGYWGPNLIRNFNNINGFNVKYACDLDIDKLNKIKQKYREINIVTDYKRILNDEDVSCVIISTSPNSHYQIAKESLMANKHIFVEKPFTTSSKHAKELIKIAEKKNLKIMVGHIFEYSIAVNKMKEIIESGELGKVLYIYSQRLNLGIIQNDINVLWDLAPHDISVILYILNKKPQSINCIGSSNISKLEDTAILIMKFDDNISTYSHFSWLDPNKVRKMTVVGSKKMLVYDDVEPLEKIKIYSKGVEIPEHYNDFGEFQYTYRYGDINIPMIKDKESLKIEVEHFCDCILNNKIPRTDGYSGLEVVKIIEKANLKMKRNYK